MTAGAVTGPNLVREVHPRTAVALADLWLAVNRARGAVGFLPDSPADDVRAAAAEAVAEVRAGRQQMLSLDVAGELAGTVFLRRGVGPRIGHRAEVLRLMVRPDLQGRGWGGALLDAAVAHATALGVEQLLLAVRGGTALPRFYAARGWTEVGVFPAALRLGANDYRDEHWFQLRL